jgi:ribosomal protein S13
MKQLNDLSRSLRGSKSNGVDLSAIMSKVKELVASYLGSVQMIRNYIQDGSQDEAVQTLMAVMEGTEVTTDSSRTVPQLDKGHRFYDSSNGLLSTDDKLLAQNEIPNSEVAKFIDSKSIDDLVEQDGNLLPRSFTRIARDVFDPLFDQPKVISTISKKKSAIKRVLLDQKVMSGVGNIYADEALWRARIHPEKMANALSVEEITSLILAVKEVMSAALKQGGTSFDDLYINVNGESGYFDVDLEAYGQEEEPCSRCGTQIRRIVFGNRSSHFCPTCQFNGRSKKSVKKSALKRGQKPKGRELTR